jgi:hypothetical protein
MPRRSPTARRVCGWPPARGSNVCPVPSRARALSIGRSLR